MTRTYTTSQIAKSAGLHPNTVRKYEEWGLIQKPLRKPNGYRIFTDIHLKQIALLRKAFQIEVMQAGLRSRIVNVVKLSAQCRFDEAVQLAQEYILIAGREKQNAKEAAEICEELYKADFQNNANEKKRGANSGGTYKDFGTSESEKTFLKRSEAARLLNLTIDTIRNWEMNGLLKVKRKKNGYRIYDTNDINRLKIIRSLRCANYSLSAILRMLNVLEYRMNKSRTDILEVLNTPDESEDIVSVCDRLVFSLEKAEENAREVISLINEIKALAENEKS